MKQPWPSTNDAEIKDQTRSRLAQTFNSPTRSKSLTISKRDQIILILSYRS